MAYLYLAIAIVSEVVGLAGDRTEITLAYHCWTHVYRAL